MAFSTLINRYLDHAKARFTKKTYEEKVFVVRAFLEHLGGQDMPVDEITASHVDSYLLARAARTSNNAANRDRKNLAAMFHWGERVLDLPSNPAAKTDRFSHDRAPQYTPPESDVLKVLAAASGVDRVFLECYLHTGARRSEIFSLLWEDVNFERGEIRLWTRKTKDGSREGEWLPMTRTLAESLRWWWENRTFKDAPHVFLDDHPGPHYGQPYLVRRRYLKGLCDRAGVPQFGFHALRRYVASMLADRHKVSSKTIQRVLRHKNVTTTERYIQRINQDLRSTMDLLDFDESTPDSTPETEKGARRLP